ncbi:MULTISPECIES: patatin-like phospholipase family protein [Pseudoalteromonas]|uniref:PNPLA domain-containing protein n=3 Tax=Pseudoalteromonas TaxID=53246 RepID=Q3IIV1_PSET1|nr:MULTISPECIES: patatin-like phospholipase family protein [Pseudoalteromonas]ALS33557.1 NTE family protein [Pseudoalteromonas translucida KMM 520]ASM54657.1 NTE family protein [Pseudoalteromonas nigrifaciens]MBB1370568.1 patatin-like phospholipase family protein [Pseudoalteromonas sp. SR45-4]MBB1406483.1 patatin-like phospholipase family protein [Pseudoalteromonas sp. SG44-5]MBE0418924.1 patatin-like phospholipase family protein [Pseudoalteromonas nigrifaciens]|tara:strand:+ start:11021 stop:12166 length:1146 start_codon:yes stop_codon:yes gene_type:complete
MKIKQVDPNKPKVALLLTGGGARAAYQVGVLKALAHSMPRTAPLPFRVINGTSAGAINSAALACYASCAHLAVRKLESVWKNFSTSMVYKSDFLSVFGHITRNILTSFQSEHINHPPASLLNNRPLRKLLNEILDLHRIERNLHHNYLEALSITASSYTTGDSVAFYQSNTRLPWQRAKREGRATRINVEHLMASSAIPMVFPSVNIYNHYFGDGSIHQLSPLSPSIHLGAEKIFIIGVEQPKELHPVGYSAHYPGLSSVAGHLLDSVFTDTMQSDLERLERINRTLGLLPARDKHQELKRIETCVINPSQNFNAIAAQYYDDMPWAIKVLLRIIGVKKHSQSSLTSYLLFEKRYTQHLIQIGYEDGMKKLPEIRKFLELD